MNLKEIISKVRSKAIENYEADKKFTNTDMGKEMIIFTRKNIDCRKVNDWGRDEDTDLVIGIVQEGWIKYTQTIHWGAGPLSIESSNTVNVDDDFIVNYLNSDECTNKEFMNFMRVACKYYPRI